MQFFPDTRKLLSFKPVLDSAKKTTPAILTVSFSPSLMRKARNTMKWEKKRGKKSGRKERKGSGDSKPKKE